MSALTVNHAALVADIRQLIDSARQRVALAVNAELTLLYWQVGRRVQVEVLQGERAAYGQEVVKALAARLTADYGKGWSEKQLRHCLRLAETFPDEAMLSALRRALSWTHIKALIYIDDALKRDFYIELCRLERWSSRQLQERMNSMLYERSALSKKPEETIRHELARLRQTQQVSPELLLKDPYVLDFLGLNDRYLEKDLEGAILRDMEQFLLELGAGFSFVARQKRIQIDQDTAIEALALLCEPVEPPKTELESIRYFCDNTEIPSDLAEREPHRVALYKGVVTLIRAYANIANELEPAGYGPTDIERIKRLQKHYLDLREVIRKAAGETLDLKPFEADMRHLIDTYIEASAPRKISPFDDIGLLDLIVNTGIAAAIASQLGEMKGNKDAIAETIENNVRSKIIKESLTDPAYYEKMSALLNEIIRLRKEKAIEYEEYLKRIAELATKVQTGKTDDTPARLDTLGRRERAPFSASVGRC
ncbi:hypothetical protein LMG10661_02686 [Ralstonia syzygii subsp. syzygii]|nr:hypothetical protein LMG10661_02686 [Ralstonia syzygii subsp. syzygii]